MTNLENPVTGETVDINELDAAIAEAAEARENGWEPASVADALAHQLERADRLREQGWDPTAIPFADHAAVLSGGFVPPDTARLKGRTQATGDFQDPEPEPEFTRPVSMSAEAFVALERPETTPLIGEPRRALMARYGLGFIVGRGGHGKTSLVLDLVLHLVSGVEWLGFAVPRPLKVLLIENEGPEHEFAEKLAIKLKTWEHEIKGEIRVLTLNWGAFTLGDEQQLELLIADVDQHGYDLVVGDPLGSLGMAGAGSPEETRSFLRLLKKAGLWTKVAFLLLHHPHKREAIDPIDELSGDWGGHPDAIFGVKMEAGDRTRLSFHKLRHWQRGKRAAMMLAFDPDTERFTFVADVEEVERDYATELEELLAGAERIWWTRSDLAEKNHGGIGASRDKVGEALEQRPDLFEKQEGKEVGRPKASEVYRLLPQEEAPA
jgi:AAA domain